MKRIYLLAITLLVALLVSSCMKAPAPLLQAQGLTPGGNNAQPSTDTTPKQCDQAINYQVLIDALPKSVNGYTAGTPDGNMMTFTDPSTQKEIKYSTAKVSLTSGDNNIDVSATDTCYLQFLSMAWQNYYEVDGTDGFLKKTTIGGNTAWHQYSKSSGTYTYDVLVNNRVIIVVDGSDGVADSDVAAAANAIDFASISAAAK